MLSSEHVRRARQNIIIWYIGNFSRNTHSTDFIEHLDIISKTNASIIKTNYPTLERNLVSFDCYVYVVARNSHNGRRYFPL